MDTSDGRDNLVFTVARLRASLVWEVRTLYLVPVGIAIGMVSIVAGQVIVMIMAASVLLADSSFSLIATSIFLRPILSYLKMTGVDGRKEMDGAQKLLHRKYATSCGCFITVASSSLLYINLGLWAVIKNQFHSSPYLNPLVFGVNFSSALNDLGILLVSGAFKSVFQKIVWLRSSTKEPSKRGAAGCNGTYAKPSLVFSSYAEKNGNPDTNGCGENFTAPEKGVTSQILPLGVAPNEVREAKAVQAWTGKDATS
jgi:hypothetical protein